MFTEIPGAVLNEMRRLEAIDSRDRTSGAPQSRRLRQITPDTGRFISLLAAAAPPGNIIEIGTSAGYSTLWLALACRETRRTITTFEIDEFKIGLARETFRTAGVEECVELVHGDPRSGLSRINNVGFCFLDAEKDVYGECYDLVVPALVRGGFLVADNATSHATELEQFITMVLRDPRVDAMVVPVGKGELVCRKR